MRELLIRHGADLNHQYGPGKITILHRIAKVPNYTPSPQQFWEKYCQDALEIAKWLIASGADVNAKDAFGNTPLFSAAYSTNHLMIKMLVAKGAKLSATNNEGNTALIASTSLGHWGYIERELITLGTLVSLEKSAGMLPDWTKLREIAKKAYDQREKNELLSMIDQLEKLPPELFQDSAALESSANKIIDSAPKTREERLGACNPEVALAAAREVIDDPNTLNEPMELFKPSFVFLRFGKLDDAVFWFYAAQLRVRYQMTLVNDDRGQLLSIMMMTAGPAINNYAYQNVSNFVRIIDQVLAWDRRTPNPFSDKVDQEGKSEQVAQIYTGLHNLKAKVISEKNDIEHKARLAGPDMERLITSLNNHCGKNTRSSIPVTEHKQSIK